MRQLIWASLLFALPSAAKSLGAEKPAFTPWMDDQAFHDWRSANLNHQPFYLTAIEGRVADGHKEWRVMREPKPQHSKWSWKWYSQLDDKTYLDFCHRMLDQAGYQLIWSQTFVDLNGEKLHQAIFLHGATEQ
jgi:hypothetical protein